MHRVILPAFLSLASAAVHTVEVGESGLDFNPQTITAAEGDTVIFELYSPHDVVEGEFESPCQTSDNDFYSGPYSDTNNGARKFVVNITSSDPIYYYCSVQRHCQSGMVGGINIPTSGNTIEAYSQAAANAQQAETPDQLRGGQLLDDTQLASLTSSAGSASSSASASASASSATSGSATSTASTSGSASQSASAATASATGAAAERSSGQVGGIAALVLGVAAWLI